MPICENCNNKWNWKQTIKKTNTLNPEMICPYCGGRQYQTQKSKTKIAPLTIIVLLPLLIQAFFDIPGAILLSSIPVLAVIVFLVYPFLVELSSEEKYINFFKDK